MAYNPKFLEDVAGERCFWLKNGKVVRNIYELVDALEHADPDVYQHHANEIKNDFAEWIQHTLGNKSLADQIRMKSRQDTLEILKAEIYALEDAIEKSKVEMVMEGKKHQASAVGRGLKKAELNEGDFREQEPRVFDSGDYDSGEIDSGEIHKKSSLHIPEHEHKTDSGQKETMPQRPASGAGSTASAGRESHEHSHGHQKEHDSGSRTEDAHSHTNAHDSHHHTHTNSHSTENHGENAKLHHELGKPDAKQTNALVKNHLSRLLNAFSANIELFLLGLVIGLLIGRFLLAQ